MRFYKVETNKKLHAEKLNIPEKFKSALKMRVAKKEAEMMNPDNVEAIPETAE